jgi:hypothetical protein
LRCLPRSATEALKSAGGGVQISLRTRGWVPSVRLNKLLNITIAVNAGKNVMACLRMPEPHPVARSSPPNSPSRVNARRNRQGESTVQPASRSHSPVGCLSRRAEPQGFSVRPRSSLYSFSKRSLLQQTNRVGSFGVALRRCSSALLFGVALRRCSSALLFGVVS